MKITSSPMMRNEISCTCAHATPSKCNDIKKQLEIRPCWVPNSQQDVATVTMEKPKRLSAGIPHVPKIGTSMCFSYPSRQVSNSWHTQDRFFLHKRKGEVTSCFYHCNSNEFLSKHAECGTIYPDRVTKPTYDLSH